MRTASNFSFGDSSSRRKSSYFAALGNRPAAVARLFSATSQSATMFCVWISWRLAAPRWATPMTAMSSRSLGDFDCANALRGETQ